MSEYKELVAELKELAEEEKEFASNSGDIYCAEKLALAADAIEQLVRERDDERGAADGFQHDYFEKCAECAQLKRERDAAVADAKEFRECCSCPHRCFNQGGVQE